MTPVHRDRTKAWGGQQCKPFLRNATVISQKREKQKEIKQEKNSHIKWGIQVRREANTDAGALIQISLVDKEKNGQCLLILDSVLIQSIFLPEK